MDQFLARVEQGDVLKVTVYTDGQIEGKYSVNGKSQRLCGARAQSDFGAGGL